MTRKIPELRFIGFDGEWEENKIGKHIKLLRSGLSRKLSDYDLGLPVVRANNIDNGFLNLDDNIKYWHREDPQGANTENYFIEKDDILINFINSDAKMGTAAIVRDEPGRDTIYTTNIMRLQPKVTLNPNFIFYYTFTDDYKKHIKSITKSAVNQSSFTTVDFKKLRINIPEIEEQEKIGELFETLDACLEDQAAYVETLKKSKKAFLQKLFPKKGKKVPELRFPGFVDDWEVEKIQEITINENTKRIPVSEQERTSGVIPYYGANGIVDYVDGYTHDGVNILVAEDGASDLSNYPVNITDSKIWVNNHAHVLKSIENKSDSYFLKESLSNMNYHEYVVGGSRHKLNREVLMNIKILLPSLPEQEKIGAFFKALDEKIEKEEDKLDSLERLKTALLQKVFV